MQLVVRSGDALTTSADLAVIMYAAATELPSAVAGLIETADADGKAQSALTLYPRNGGARRVLLLGTGPAAQLTLDTVRSLAALAVQRAGALKAATLSVAWPADWTAAQASAWAEGAALGAYSYTRYQSDAVATVVPEITVFAADSSLEAAFAAGLTVARGVALARDLANGPGNAVTPSVLAEQALELGTRLGLSVTVLGTPELKAQGFGGMLAVGGGSANEPRFIVMEYGTAGSGPTICLVGKGITFDTGGISLKPADKMEDMKMDMSGAAAVFGAVQAAAELQLPLHVVGIVVAAENMPSATAYRPGDIVRTLSGKTVEVLNTDAEGRIVLADGLFYAQRYQPAAIIDLATLTGAITVALGPYATGLMGNNQALADRVLAAGEATAERCWQLPLWEPYHKQIKSEIGDIKNTGGRQGGAITAAAFLAAFVGEFPWVHLDIAGTAWVEKPAAPYQVRGATGVGVRLLIETMRSYL